MSPLTGTTVTLVVYTINIYSHCINWSNLVLQVSMNIKRLPWSCLNLLHFMFPWF